MTLPADENQSFEPWRELVEGISKFPKVAVKLSGVFSEIDHAGSTDVKRLAALVLPWVRVAFECFGPERVMWGSDWPVCNIGYGEMVGREKQNGAWRCWRAVTEKVLEILVQDGIITEVQADDVWGAVAVRIYGL
jgi:L-rhamnono-1,4-lactonase